MKAKPKPNWRYNQMAGFKKAEDKFFDTALSFNIDATGEVPATGQLCLVQNGTSDSSRIGNKIVVKSIQIRGVQILVPGASTTGACTTYVYVVLDKQCNGAAAAVTDVLTGTSLASAFINLANSERFVILKRFVTKHACSAGVQTAFSQTSEPMEWFHKCNIPILFDASAGAITDLTSNNIFLIAGTDGQGDDLVAVDGRVRLRFSDN